jgi:hypothetical protein
MQHPTYTPQVSLQYGTQIPTNSLTGFPIVKAEDPYTQQMPMINYQQIPLINYQEMYQMQNQFYFQAILQQFAYKQMNYMMFNQNKTIP